MGYFMTKAVVFDWDGVIVDSLGTIEDWFRYCCSKFGKEYPFSTKEEMIEEYQEPFPKMFEKFGFDWERDRDSVIELFYSFMKDRNIPIKEGMVEVLEELSGSGYSMGIVSSNREEIIEESLDRFGIGSYFEALITHRERDEYLKPSPRMLEVCMDRLGVLPSNTVYIGDQPTDVVAAERAGVETVVVTWGYSTKDKFRSVNPDHIVETPEELTAAVRSILG